MKSSKSTLVVFALCSALATAGCNKPAVDEKNSPVQSTPKPGQANPAQNSEPTTPKKREEAKVKTHTFQGKLVKVERQKGRKDALAFSVGDSTFWTLEVETKSLDKALSPALIMGGKLLLKIEDKAILAKLADMNNKMVEGSGVFQPSDDRAWKPAEPVQAPVDMDPMTGERRLRRPGSAARVIVQSLKLK